MVVEDKVAADAVLEPEIAAKPAPASVVATPSPPGTRPTQAVALLNRPSAMPLKIMNSAISMNIGMVINS